MAEILKTILVVEDERSILKAIVDKLKIEGFNTLQAENGEDGLKTALDSQPNLILLDLIMPKMTGLQMMRLLRGSNPYGKSVPIIILTNLSATDQINAEVSKDEPSYYLVKTDWKIDDVIKKIRETLNNEPLTEE